MDRVKERPHLAEWLYNISSTTIPHSSFVDSTAIPQVPREEKDAGNLVPPKCELCAGEKLVRGRGCARTNCQITYRIAVGLVPPPLPLAARRARLPRSPHVRHTSLSSQGATDTCWNESCPMSPIFVGHFDPQALKGAAAPAASSLCVESRLCPTATYATQAPVRILENHQR